MYIKPNKETGTSYASPLVAMTKLISFWDLMGAERKDNPKSMLELEAETEMQSRTQQDQEDDNDSMKYRSPTVEVDLTAESPSESPEASVIGGEEPTANLGETNFGKQIEQREKA